MRGQPWYAEAHAEGCTCADCTFERNIDTIYAEHNRGLMLTEEARDRLLAACMTHIHQEAQNEAC